jgi:hypothetical protein
MNIIIIVLKKVRLVITCINTYFSTSIAIKNSDFIGNIVFATDNFRRMNSDTAALIELAPELSRKILEPLEVVEEVSFSSSKQF